MKNARKIITQLDDDKMNKQLAAIEAFKYDSRKYYQAIHTVKTRTPPANKLSFPSRLKW